MMGRKPRMIEAFCAMRRMRAGRATMSQNIGTRDMMPSPIGTRVAGLLLPDAHAGHVNRMLLAEARARRRVLDHGGGPHV